MTALREITLPDAIRNEVARLKGAGFPLLPLGGADGKAPLSRAWAGPGLTLARILAPMHRTGSTAYGVRLDGLAVVDCDSDVSGRRNFLSIRDAMGNPNPVTVTCGAAPGQAWRLRRPLPSRRGHNRTYRT